MTSTDATASSTGVRDLAPNGSTVTTYGQLYQLVETPGWSPPVVLDRHGVPWILFCNENGDDFAATVPCPDDGIPDHVPLGHLAAHGPLLVLSNGDRQHLDNH